MENEIKDILSYLGMGMAVILPIGIYGFLLIDKLIKRMYESFNAEWQKVGKPSGMFYFPPEGRSLQSMISMQLNIFVWFFKTPVWIKSDAVSLENLKRLRWSFAIANIAMLILFVVVFLMIKDLIQQ
ncbi:hypothetical protein [Sulfurovum sp.]|uniref:hypothetical protein n=1 Tax=Sulfurovum sp. TaxID=1969726 RepID=UPI003569D18D